MGRLKKLSPEDVIYIRTNPDKLTNAELAKRFGVSMVTIIHAKTAQFAYATEG